MPDIGQFLPVDLGRKTPLRAILLGMSLGAVNRNVLRDRFVTNSQAHDLIEPTPHERERTNRVQ
jgi:hypothetical protein